jgi:hypothetical protein
MKANPKKGNTRALSLPRLVFVYALFSSFFLEFA